MSRLRPKNTLVTKEVCLYPSSSTLSITASKFIILVSLFRIECEGIKAVKELVAKNAQGKNVLDNLNNNHQSKNDESNIKKEYDPNRKFDLFFL